MATYLFMLALVAFTHLFHNGDFEAGAVVTWLVLDYSLFSIDESFLKPILLLIFSLLPI